MFKKKCPSCEKKVDRSFRFCPWCGKPTKQIRKEDYGMLGLDDEVKEQEILGSNSILGGPLGNMFNQLTKQLSKELQNMNLGNGAKPGGIEIHFSTGKPAQRVIRQEPQGSSEAMEEVLDEEELKRRKVLPVEVAISKIRRLPEGIIYEIDTPGVKSKQDVSILRMENSLEIKAYSLDKCYIKTIPIKVDVVKYVVKDNKVFVQLKN